MLKKKVCLLGAFSVGKTSLVKRFVENIFDERYHTTVGVCIERKDMAVRGYPMTMVLWDFAGEDDTSRLRPAYLQGTSGCIFVADGTRPHTLDVAWQLRQAFEKTGHNIPFILALNKLDLQQSWTIDQARLAELKALGCEIHETSAKTGHGVEGMFAGLAVQILQRDSESHREGDHGAV